MSSCSWAICNGVSPSGNGAVEASNPAADISLPAPAPALVSRRGICNGDSPGLGRAKLKAPVKYSGDTPSAEASSSFNCSSLCSSAVGSVGGSGGGSGGNGSSVGRATAGGAGGSAGGCCSITTGVGCGSTSPSKGGACVVSVAIIGCNKGGCAGVGIIINCLKVASCCSIWS